MRTRLLAADNKGIFTPLSTKDTVSVPASNGGTLFGGAAAEPRTGAVYVVAHDNPGIVRLLRPGEGRGAGGPPVPPGQIVYQQNCQMCHGVNRQGTDTGVPLVHAGRRSGEQHRRRRAPLRRRRDSRGPRDRQEPHAAVPASQRGRRRQPGAAS